MPTDQSKSGRDLFIVNNTVVALAETTRIMGEIDEVIEEHGGGQGRCRPRPWNPYPSPSDKVAAARKRPFEGDATA